MKLTKTKLKQIIKEEITQVQKAELAKLKAKDQQTPDDETRIKDLEDIEHQ